MLRYGREEDLCRRHWVLVTIMSDTSVLMSRTWDVDVCSCTFSCLCNRRVAIPSPLGESIGVFGTEDGDGYEVDAMSSSISNGVLAQVANWCATRSRDKVCSLNLITMSEIPSCSESKYEWEEDEDRVVGNEVSVGEGWMSWC